METNDYSFILKFFILVIALILIIFGFLLTIKNNKSKSGSINFGKLSIKNSTAGIVFMIFGAVILVYSILKGVGMKHSEHRTVKTKTFDNYGNVSSETEEVIITVDSTASTPEIDSVK